MLHSRLETMMSLMYRLANLELKKVNLVDEWMKEKMKLGSLRKLLRT